MASQTESTLTTAPSSYLSYLPACSADGGSAPGLPFVALYLKIFEKQLSGIADGDDLEQADSQLDTIVAYRAGIRQLLNATVIGNLFYPRWSFLFPDSGAAVFMPALSEETDSTKQAALFDTLANDFGLPKYVSEANRLSPVEIWARSFLEWLGATIGLSVDKNWSIDASRAMIAQTFAFDRARGTPIGMTWLLNACLAARPAPVNGVSLTNLAVVDCDRPALIVFDADTEETPAFHLVDSYPDRKNAVVISDVVAPEVDYHPNGSTFTVDDSTLVAYVPWRFEVDITLSVKAGVKLDDQEHAVQAYFRLVRTVLDMAKPALTTYVVNFTVNDEEHQTDDSLYIAAPACSPDSNEDI